MLGNRHFRMTGEIESFLACGVFREAFASLPKAGNTIDFHNLPNRLDRASIAAAPTNTKPEMT